MSVEKKSHVRAVVDSEPSATTNHTTAGTESTRSVSRNLWEEPLSSLSEIGAGGFGKILIRPEKKDTVSTNDTSGASQKGGLETCLKVAPTPKNGSGGLLREFKILSFLKESSEGEPFYPLAFKYTRLADGKQECIEMERLSVPLSNLTRNSRKKDTPPQPFESRVFFDVSVQAIRCLQRLHAVGIYHGDVKPRNFVFDRDGVLRLVDFGLSQFLSHATLDVSEERTSSKTRKSDSQFRFDPAGRLLNSRTRTRFEGTTKYCSPRVHEKKSAHPSDDFVSLLYFLWEWYTQKRLPWHSASDRDAVLALKKKWTGWNELPRPLAMLYNVCKSPRLFQINEVSRLLTCLEGQLGTFLSSSK